ncbi:hypothetical protein COCSUDRAFT_53480 [Coccomyxa subellipsoidea C-169]|uniref:Uncharacterized protein n=1 Tax=Coccomyxa subellipsoidea (strain C-169) TaxID=574566 RepID=I0YX86_COCSC|nr:hypothetical protein COCSUDRAFT_53480 [Coccomyxa subellipsoidea C-169]EIE23005.1 hypothetical protein COCSUDRAFT_53480 [Coccomyxa subellipsoidea C-169]|eukprot:XP_005647549.1 hypothetical protein COCSUDRAFT_53480 [Coccomyxa subellipsoidea C-169]
MPADVIMDVADDQLPAAEAVTDSAQEPVMSAAVMSAAADSLAAVALGAERLGPVGGDTRMVDAPAVGHMNLQKGDAGTAEGTAGGLVDNMVDKME